MTIIPAAAQQLIERQAEIEIKLSELEVIIGKAQKGALGLTLDSSKTPEWKEAKRLHSIYFNAYREVNMKLSKMRRATGYEALNGKRVTIYQYK